MNAALYRIYLKLRWWTDRQFAGRYSVRTAVLLGPASLPIAIFAEIVGGDTPSERLARLAPFLVWAALWFGFVSWRAVRLLKLRSVMNDRHYDRIGKFDIPHEYATSESATKASLRRKL